MSDAIAVAITWISVTFLRSQQLSLTYYPPEHYWDLYRLTPFVALFWVVGFALLRAYRQAVLLRAMSWALGLLRDHVFISLLFVGLLYFSTNSFKVSRFILLVFFSVCPIFLILFRVVLLGVIRRFKKKEIKLRAVLLGLESEYKGLLWFLDKHRELGLQMLGSYFNEKSTKPEIKVKRLGDIEDFIARYKDKNPDQLNTVFFAYSLPTEIRKKVLSLKGLSSADFFMFPDTKELLLLGAKSEVLGSTPVLHLNYTELDSWNRALKRLFDVVSSALGIIVLSPMFAVVAILVKLSSSGPVLFKQERMSLDGKSFFIYKFRTMKVSTETVGWTVENDPRRTAIGEFLRKTSLDEFPQLWNVLVGDMSIVGPRPEQPFYANKFSDDIDFYMHRHKVKCGITGWAQVNGLRGDTSIEDRTRFDLYYIRNWTFSLDLKIILMTFYRGFVNKNAY